MRYSDLALDPEFAKLSYPEQLEVRRVVFADEAQGDLGFAALSPEERAQVLGAVESEAPVFENPDAEYQRRVSEVVSRMKLQDSTAISDAVGLASLRTGSKASLLPSLIAKGVDAVRDYLDPGKHDSLYQEYYGPDGDKAAQWLEASVAQYGGESARSALQAQTSAIAIGSNLVEALLTAIPLVGTAAKAGLLTKGIFGAEGALARGLAGLPAGRLYGAAQVLIPVGIESAAQGAVMTALDVTRQVVQDEKLNPQNLEWWGTIAKEFGTNVASGYVLWGAAKGLGAVTKSMIKTARGFKPISDLELVDSLKAATSNPQLVKEVSPEAAQGIIAGEARYRLGNLDPKSDEGMKVLAQAHGYDVSFSGDKVSFVDLANPSSPPIEAKSRAQAAQRLSEIMVTGTPATEAPEASAKGLALAQDSATRLVRTVSGELDPSASDQAVAKLVVPQREAWDEGNVTLFGRAWLKRAGVPEKVSNSFVAKLGEGVEDLGETSIRLPAVADSLPTEHAFNRALMQKLEGLAVKYGTDEGAIVAPGRTADYFSFIGPLKAKSGLTHEGLDYVARRNLGAEVVKGPSGYEFRGLDGASLGKFPDLASATSFAYSELIRTGKADIQQLSSVLQARTGYLLRKQEVPLVAGPEGKRMASGPGAQATRTLYQIVKPVTDKSGKTSVKQVASSEDLGNLLDQHPELDIRLPSTFAPEIYVVDVSVGKLITEDVVATGSLGQLLEMTSNFDDVAKAGRMVFANARGKVMKVDSATWRAENPRLGISEEVKSGLKASQKLRRWLDRTQAVEDAGLMKGLRTTYASDGTIIAYGPTGVEGRFRSLDQLEAFHANRPIPDWQKELMPIPAGSSDEAKAAIEKAAADIKLTKFRPSRVVSTVDKYFAPVEMTLAHGVKSHGDRTLLGAWREIRTGARLADASDSRAAEAWGKAFGGLSYRERVKLGYAAQWPDAVRASRYQSVFGEPMPEAVVQAIPRIRSTYDTFFRASGLPGWKFVTEYLPRLRSYLQEHMDDVVDGNTASALLHRAYSGEVPREFEFFARELRATDLLHMANIEDPLEAALEYTHSLNRARYMTPVMKAASARVDEALRSKASKIPEQEFSLFADTLREMRGMPRTETERILRRQTLAFTQALAAIGKRHPVLRTLGLDDRVITDDLVDKLNSKITLATQGTKPWAPMRNLFQVYLVSAVAGTKETWSALREILDEDADTIVNRVVSSGMATKTLPHELQREKTSIWRRIMQWNENVDVMTRAVAVRTAERLYDAAIPRLRSGKASLQDFVKESRMSILDPAVREQILSAASSGDDLLAKDLFGNQMQSLTMFDYSKMQKPLAARGIMGKAFGKFMTYPASALALYQRILTSGDLGERAAMAARLVLGTEAVYQAFKAAGVDYQGFLWSDPFGFQGGPLWTMLVDGTNIIGNTPQAKAARTSLLKNLPRTISPTYALGYSITKAMSLLDQGYVEEAAIALTGAPIRKTLMWSSRRGEWAERPTE